jgi:hypothetical protein
MKISDLVINKLKEDKDLRRKVATSINVGEQAIWNAINRNSKTLLNINSINTIKAETGLTEEQILVNNKATA